MTGSQNSELPMALVLTQVVRVRVAVVLDGSADYSVGQVVDEETNQWTDLVWIDLAGSTAWPLEFGDVEFWAEVSSLATTRQAITRPAVRLRAWRSGGLWADGYEILTTGSAVLNVAKLQRSGADLLTTLPGLGAVLNTVRIRGFQDQRVGWTGRVPAPIAWDRNSIALRKRMWESSYESAYLAGVAGFAGDLVGFNTWLADNLPEYGSAITIGATLEFSRNPVSGSAITRTTYVAVFTLHCYLSYDSSAWVWTRRGALLSVSSNENNPTVCGGASVTVFSGDTYATNAANIASIGASLASSGYGSFPTPPASGGTVTASPRSLLYAGGPSYGVDVSLTVNAQGRVTNAAVAGFSSDGTVDSVAAWGACKMEGGMLA